MTETQSPLVLMMDAVARLAIADPGDWQKILHGLDGIGRIMPGEAGAPAMLIAVDAKRLARLLPEVSAPARASLRDGLTSLAAAIGHEIEAHGGVVPPYYAR